jgi:hypothetical protein
VSALALTSVEGWTLATAGFSDGQPRVRDLELAEHLGYEKPYDVRKLITRLAESGRLGIVATVAKNQTGRGRPTSEFWLTEAQALKVVAKSGTPKADAILDEVIRVFIAVRGSALAAPAAPAAIDVQMRALFGELMSPVLATIGALAKTIQDLSGSTITDADWRWLRREVCQLAELRQKGNPNSRGPNSERRIIYNKLGSAVAWTGSGRPWRLLPASKVADAKATLAEMRREAERHVPMARQLSLLPANGGAR